MIVTCIKVTFKNGYSFCVPVHIYTFGTTSDNQIIETFKIFFEEWEQEIPEISLAYKTATAEEKLKQWQKEKEK
jgi:hypothetical protein